MTVGSQRANDSHQPAFLFVNTQGEYGRLMPVEVFHLVRIVVEIHHHHLEISANGLQRFVFCGDSR